MARLPRLLAVALLAAALVPASALGRDVLPDLDQEQPSDLEVTTDLTGEVPRFHLGFDSAVDDVGAGPLTINAHRASTDEPQMVADQVIQRSGGGTRTVRDVGRLQYTYSEDHDHWHFLGFERYELRRASDARRVARDHKTGFCLGNRYAVKAQASQAQAAQAPRVTYRDFSSHCGLNRTRLRKVTEGISVGWGDDYKPLLEGQYVDITKVRGGRYVLVHSVNPSRKLLEADYTNNASSVLLRITRHGSRKPTIRILARCPREARCTAG
jgi:hypothetical protein